MSDAFPAPATAARRRLRVEGEQHSTSRVQSNVRREGDEHCPPFTPSVAPASTRACGADARSNGKRVTTPNSSCSHLELGPAGKQWPPASTLCHHLIGCQCELPHACLSLFPLPHPLVRAHWGGVSGKEAMLTSGIRRKAACSHLSPAAAAAAAMCRATLSCGEVGPESGPKQHTCSNILDPVRMLPVVQPSSQTTVPP